MPILSAPAILPALRRAARAILLAIGLGTAGIALPALANGLDEASQSLKSGQHAKALEQIDRYLASKPKDAQGRFLKGIILTGMNRTNEAIKIFQKLTEDYPDLPEPYNNLAVIYAQQNQYDRAKEALEKAIRTHPAYATAHENLGDIYTRLASQAYGKALQIDGSNASAQTKLAMISDLVGTGKSGSATAVAAKAPPAAPAPAAAPPAPPPVVAVPAPRPAATVVASAETKPASPAKAEPAKPAEPKPSEKPVESKPEPATAKAASASSSDADIAGAVDGWLAAWSKKDIKAYLGAYAKDFQTPNGQTRKEWENERSQRVGKPGKIEVSRDKLAIKSEGEDKAVVRFRQHYRSSNLNTSSGKTLVLVKRDGRWLIQQERVGG